MATTTPGIVLRRLRELGAGKDVNTAPDQQLLERFANAREEAAFEALVRRHGPLVLGVCRRVLHQEQDAEDVFQATFLVLAQKAGSISKRAAVGNWLYRVAYHMALQARKQAAVRQKREVRATRRDVADPLAEVTGRELLAVFDEELQNLPEGERAALVLCYLDGKTRDEAARDAGISESTLKRRLERGKERMRTRLARRGVALPAALLAAGLAQGARAAVPRPLVTSAVKAGCLLATDQAAAGIASAQAHALANETLRAMTARKVRTAGALLVAIALLGVGTGLLASAPRAVVPVAAKEPPQILALAADAEPAPDDEKKMTVSGRVLDAEGKPLAGADVAVVAEPERPSKGFDYPSETDVLGKGKSDDEGRFTLDVPRTSSRRFRVVSAVAGGAGHVFGWLRLDPDAEKPAAEIRLAPEQVIRGRLVDWQGQPAAAVTVRICKICRPGPALLIGYVSAPAELPFGRLGRRRDRCRGAPFVSGANTRCHLPPL